MLCEMWLWAVMISCISFGADDFILVLPVMISCMSFGMWVVVMICVCMCYDLVLMICVCVVGL